MAFTGFALTCFLIVHAVGNCTIFWGRSAFLSYADHLHSLGPLLPIAQLLLTTLFILHIIVGGSLFFQNRRARPLPYVITMQKQPDFISRTMPYSGLAILLFLIIHIFTLHSGQAGTNIADIVTATLTSPLYATLYLTGITALSLHLYHGMCSIFQSVGLGMVHRKPWIAKTARGFGLWPMVIFFAIIFLLLISSGNLLQ